MKLIPLHKQSLQTYCIFLIIQIIVRRFFFSLNNYFYGIKQTE